MTLPAPDHLLDQTIAVQRAVTTIDTDGSPELTWSTHLASLRARLRPVRPGRAIEAGRPVERRRWMIYFGADHDIVAGDRIVHDGSTLRITGILDHGESGMVKTANAEELHL